MTAPRSGRSFYAPLLPGQFAGWHQRPERRNPAPTVLEPIVPDEKPAVGLNAEPIDATTCPHLPCTNPRASPDALPPEIAALSVP